MFTGFKHYAIGLIAITLLGLSGWIWHQNQMLINLRAENQAQAQTIQQQAQANAELSKAIESERLAIEEQKAINDEIQQRQQESIRTVRTIIKSHPCANTAISPLALERLR